MTEREFFRLDYSSDVEIYCVDTEMTVKAETRDISAGGVQLVVFQENPLDIGMRVRIDIRLEDNLHKLRGVVLRKDKFNHKESTISIQFIMSPTEQQDLLTDIWAIERKALHGEIKNNQSV